MDWDQFFERTRAAAGVDSYSKLAPLLGITDGAIGHYRQGRRVPQVWVVAEALKIQKHPTPERAAIEIMKAAALTSPERAFWKRLAATASMLILACSLSLDAKASGIEIAAVSAASDLHYAKLRKAAAAVLRLTARGLRWLASIAAKEAPHASTVLA